MGTVLDGIKPLTASAARMMKSITDIADSFEEEDGTEAKWGT